MGSDAATREWAYTAMSRGALATHYYEVQQPPERDALGVHHMHEQSRSAEERTVEAWERSEQKEAALDYPARYTEAERDHLIGGGTSRAATEAQRDLLAHLGAPELRAEATWVEASLEIDRCMGNAPGSRIHAWLRDMAFSEFRIREVLQEALRTGDITPESLRWPHGRAGYAVDGDRTLAANPLLQAAEHEMMPALEPGLSPW